MLNPPGPGPHSHRPHAYLPSSLRSTRKPTLNPMCLPQASLIPTASLPSALRPTSHLSCDPLCASSLQGKSGKPLHFKDSVFHRVIPQFMLQVSTFLPTPPFTTNTSPHPPLPTSTPLLPTPPPSRPAPPHPDTSNPIPLHCSPPHPTCLLALCALPRFSTAPAVARRVSLFFSFHCSSRPCPFRHRGVTSPGAMALAASRSTAKRYCRLPLAEVVRRGK